MPCSSLRSFPEGSWAQSVAAASFAYVLHFAWGVLSHQLISRTNLGLAVSGFNAEMPPWAWQVGKSLPREGTPCRYHGHGHWGGWLSTRSGDLAMFRGFQGTQRGLEVPFPTPGRVSWPQSLCVCPVCVYGSDRASAPPWALQSSLGISFWAFNLNFLSSCQM